MSKLVKKVKVEESKISQIMGIVVVIVVGFLLIRHFQKSASQEPVSKEKTSEQQETEKITPTINEYVVENNDSLWKISEKVYGSGYNWIDIAKANNLKNPNVINQGEKLAIPSIAQKEKPVEIVKTQSDNKSAITGNSYTIAKGDSLWDISVRAYQDGYKWLQIAKANNLSTNPGLIHPGNVLTIPR